ncbi:hypothetical protein HIM_04151 [Hirsutella minnesotensis 3608]|uniref:Uncharacterized protein n=1 Tax=Hirsutella minnesotensis 3608 TaxID=1043627 RepID=A0A0F8A1R0_9HYPO|nr:hypothetical protein HIM_04151 [Hirsutella minnesotensis 3608]
MLPPTLTNTRTATDDDDDDDYDSDNDDDDNDDDNHLDNRHLRPPRHPRRRRKTHRHDTTQRGPYSLNIQPSRRI